MGFNESSRVKFKSEFIMKSTVIHNNKYDYSFVEYVNSYTKVIIICPEHGKFSQLPMHHIKGSNCPICAKNTGNSKKTIKTNEFINKANKIHNNQYDYSMTEYVGCFSKVNIICKKHGLFTQVASNHLKMCGCPECGKELTDKSKKLTNIEFINKASKIHNNKYDYKLVEYKNTLTEVKIICLKHGMFEQKPRNHIQGHGCPNCFVEISRGHNEVVQFIKSIYDGNIINNDRNIIKPYEIDIYLPELNFAIEFHGDYWHSYDGTEKLKDKNKNQNKHKLCLNNDINLIQIFEYEWLNYCNIIKSIIRCNVNKSVKIDCNSCHILINNNIKQFVSDNSINNDETVNTSISLLFNDKMVYSLLLNSSGNDWKIIKFVNLCNHDVVNGKYKLLNYFINKFKPDYIYIDVDARFSSGDFYKKFGFKYNGISSPTCKYIKGDTVCNGDDCLLDDGFRRIWNAGYHRFVLNNNG